MVTQEQIQKFCNGIVREFNPEKIILFGSCAYGTPREDSDVDLLVVMSYDGHPCRKALEILLRLRPSFGPDLLVRSSSEIETRLNRQDFFIRDITAKGKTIYEARQSRVV